ncbi:MAG: formate dehydrogenase accessory sulfurtransferase FdhD [Polyangiaceae bacterium]|jgi:FdhD protein
MRLPPLRHVRVSRATRPGAPPASGARDGRDDQVVVEEPLEIRISGDTLAITMRTPGHDRELVLGFLWAEGIIHSLSDVGSIAHCGREGDEAFGDTMDVVAAAGARLTLPEEPGARRGTLTTSACGVCGRRSIDDLLARCHPIESDVRISPAAIARAVETLRERQPLFAQSGGCHAASLVSLDGVHVATFEDVGRHNAVDKLVGSRLLAGGIPAAEHALVVSGRTSFEIVQKAVTAGIPVVVGVSASSSLAVDVAKRAGVTLIGFARGGEFLVYTGEERVSL